MSPPTSASRSPAFISAEEEPIITRTVGASRSSKVQAAACSSIQPRRSDRRDYRPVGSTDSELAFCHLLEWLRGRFGAEAPALPALFGALQAWAANAGAHGVLNFLLSNGEFLFAHCSDRLWYIVRQAPFTTAHLVDEDVAVDFSEVTTPEDRVAVIATLPLTDNETWTALDPGELAVFQNGERLAATNLVIR